MSLVSQISALAAAFRDKLNTMTPRLAPLGGSPHLVLTKASLADGDFAWAKVAMDSLAASGTASSATILRGDGAWMDLASIQPVWSNITGTLTDQADLAFALSQKQTLDARLTALAALDATTGLLEQTGPSSFGRRSIGAAASTDILSRAAGDGRYSQIGHLHTVASISDISATLYSFLASVTLQAAREALGIDLTALATNDALTTGLGTKEPSISTGTTAQFWRGDKSWQTLDKAAVGLANVDNTSDVNKPISTAQQSAITLKLDKTHEGQGGLVHALAVASGLAGFISGADQAKLNAIAAGATANQTDSYLLDRSHHTGVQGSGTITLSQAALLGRTTGSSGPSQEVLVGGGLTLSSGSLALAAAVSDISGLQSALDAKVNTASLSALGLTFVGKATASDMRTVLQLGTAATQDATAFVSVAALGANSGVATLDSTGKLPVTQLPPLAVTSVTVVASDAAMLALVAQPGDIAIRSDNGKTYINNGGTTGTDSDWSEIQAPGGVTAVNGLTGAVTITAASVGLGNVDNTSDANKPVSTAAQTAFDLKLDKTHEGQGGSVHALATESTAGFISALDKTKLDGVAAGATANQTDAYLIDRSHHTGTQAYSTVTMTGPNLLLGKVTTGSGALETISLASSLEFNAGQLRVASAYPATLNLAITQVTGLQTALNAKLDNSLASTLGLQLLGASDALTARGYLSLGTAAVHDTTDFAAKIHTHVINDVIGLQTALDAKQTLNSNLTALSGLGSTLGVVEQYAAGAFQIRQIGVGDPSYLLSTGLGDGRYSAINHVHGLFSSSSAGFAPSTGGATTTFLRADGTWAAPAVPTGTWGAIVGTLSDQSDLWTQLTGKEPTITAGTTAQYWRGDKSWQTLDKTAVGLSNVDNTSDANKPISTAQQTALNAKEPTITAGTTGQYWRGDKSWQTLDKTAVGLANVDNTSDANKPVSTAQQTALNLKANLGGATFTGKVLVPNSTTSSAGLNVGYGVAVTAPANGDLWATSSGLFFATNATNFQVATTASLTNYALLTGAAFTGSISASNFSGSAFGSNTGDQTITLTGDVTGTGTGSFTTTIGANKVTLAQMAQVSTGTFLGRTTAATGNVEAMTSTQATALLNTFTTTLKGLVPPPSTTTGKFLKDDGTWATALTNAGAFEPAITAGTAAQYWRGDKSWQTLDKTAVGLPNVDNTSDVNKPVSTAQQTALNLKANIASPTFTGTVTLGQDPASGLQAATKQYVDNVAQGLDAKQSVLCASTTNLTLSGEQTIDGATTSASRVLAMGQTTSAQNGIYVTAAGAWTRASDMSAWTQFPGAFTFIEQGTLYGDTGWVCIADQGGTLGTTAVTWTQFSGVGTYSASGGITLSGKNFSLATMAANAIRGNNTASAAIPADLTGAQVTAMLSTFTSSLQGLAPASGGGTTNFLRADGTWAAPAGGGGTTTNALTLNSSGSGAASGTTFNGGTAVTLSYNTIGAQPLNSNLTAYAGANWSAGVQVPTLTAANTIALKTVGSATGNLLDKASGDSLYQATSGNLTALAGLDSTTGLLEQTGASTFTRRALGIAASTSVLTRGDGDARYAPTVSNWTPVSATGTGSSQSITLPESGLGTKDVIVAVEGLIQNPADYSITGTTLTITAPNTSDIVVRKINASAGSLRSINAQAASYTLVLSDQTGYVRQNVGTANTVTVPLNSSVAFPVGTEIKVFQKGTGQTSIAAAAGVTINTPATLKLRAQYSTATLIKVGADEWDAGGDLSLT